MAENLYRARSRVYSPSVLFLHPDMGIGGAERLVLDAALALQVCDQVSACIPVFKLARRRKRVLFYCHFPDLLLTQRNSALKKFYRAPIDWIEEYTTGMADRILVNSQYTASVFKETFGRAVGCSYPLSHLTSPETGILNR